MLQTEFTELIQAVFEDCRLIGVYWGNLQSSISYRPLIAKMEGNYLKYNTFSVSNLEKMDFQTNTFHQTVFEECNLMQTKWNDCDLTDCEIVKSNLKKADLRDSFGFHIDLKTCQVENTQISSFEALSLLSQLGIDVD